MRPSATRLRAFACALLAIGCGPCLAGDRAAERQADGAAIFHSYCSVCHGDAGNGKTSARTALAPPPADFTSPQLRAKLTPQYMAAIVRNGKPGTAMVGWRTRLDEAQIAAVVDYVRATFVSGKPLRSQRRYHTPENGWPDHDRYAAAFPFARGELSAATGDVSLDADQRRGKRLFLQACITCHQAR